MKLMEEENTSLGEQIYAAEQRIKKADIYERQLGAIEELCHNARAMVNLRGFPDDIRLNHKKALDVIIADLKTMRYDMGEVASVLGDHLHELREERDNQDGTN